MSSVDDPNKKKEKSEYYYLENGLVVFTEAYHRARGYCCENGCRHCPFGYKKKNRKPPGTTERFGGF